MAAISVDEGLKYIVRGQACLFLGSGFSKYFRGIDNRPLPLGSGLA